MRRDGLIATAVIGLAVAYLYATTQIPRLAVGDPLGPKIFPAIIGGALLLGGLMLLFETRQAMAAGESAERFDWRAWLPLAAVIGWTFLYVSMFETLGYVIATATYLFVLMVALHRGRPLTNLATAVLFTLGTSFLFTEILDVRLARGLLSF